MAAGFRDATEEIRQRAKTADERFGAYMRARVLPAIQRNPSQSAALTEQLVAVQGLATDRIISDYTNPEMATAATFRVIVSPMVSWIWIGAMVMALGGVVSLTDRRYRVGAPAPRPARDPAAVPAE